MAGAVAGRDVKGDLPQGFDAVFRYSLLDPSADVDAEAALFRFPFSHLATLIQIPGVDVVDAARTEKGEDLTDRERAVLEERIGAARAWLDAFAADDAKIVVQPTLPEAASALDQADRVFLASLLERAEDLAKRSMQADGEVWQASIFEIATSVGMKPGRAFRALYLAFLGRTNGPRAGWLLAKLEQDFVEGRLREAAAGGTLPA